MKEDFLNLKNQNKNGNVDFLLLTERRKQHGKSKGRKTVRKRQKYLKKSKKKERKNERKKERKKELEKDRTIRERVSCFEIDRKRNEKKKVKRIFL